MSSVCSVFGQRDCLLVSCKLGNKTTTNQGTRGSLLRFKALPQLTEIAAHLLAALRW